MRRRALQTRTRRRTTVSMVMRSRFVGAGDGARAAGFERADVFLWPEEVAGRLRGGQGLGGGYAAGSVEVGGYFD